MARKPVATIRTGRQARRTVAVAAHTRTLPAAPRAGAVRRGNRPAATMRTGKLARQTAGRSRG